MHLLSSDHRDEMFCFLFCLESEDECVGCPQLISFNDTSGLQLIKTSLDHFNKNNTLNRTFALLEIGRMGSQVHCILNTKHYL